MLLERIEKHIILGILKEDFRKIGVNFVTAGIVGVFIQHWVGSNHLAMLWTSVSVTTAGLMLMLVGTIRRGK